MGWVSAPADGDRINIDLPDDRPIKLRLREAMPDVDTMFGSGNRIALVWEAVEFGDGDDTRPWVRDWLSIKLGQNSGGQPSKLRMLINALHGRQPNADVAGCDDGWEKEGVAMPEDSPDRFAYSLDGSKTDGQLKAGIEIMAMGETVVKKKDGDERTIWKVVKYRPLAAPDVVRVQTVPKATGRPAARPPAAATAASGPADF